MGTTEPVAIFPVAAQCIQVCFLLRAKVQRDWSGSGVSMQFCTWCVPGRRGFWCEGCVVVLSGV